MRSPFYGNEPQAFFENEIYGYYIHPEWEYIGSETLYLKVLYVDYTRQFCVIELIGEWNDALHNDVMYLKCRVIDNLLQNGITQFILIGENVLNFHGSDDCYYEDWFEEIGTEGWIVGLNFRDFVLEEMGHYNVDNYLIAGGRFDMLNWRTMEPLVMYRFIRQEVMRRIDLV